MNLVAYDTLSSPVDKTRTWIDFANKRIMSREFPHRKYDDPPTDRLYRKLLFDGYGRSKISLKSIWEEIGFNKITHDCNIKINHIEHTDDGDIYEIDF